MGRWSAWLAAGLCCAVLAACSVPNNSGSLEPPDLLDQVANADLSPRGRSGSGTPRVEFASSHMANSETELYPGNDVVAKKPKKPSGQGISEGSNGYELNFSDAELSELAKVILRDTLSLPYVFDPRVQGRVTVSTGGPVSRRELLSILESVLSMNRGALVIDGKLYRIVPETEARQNAVLSVSYDNERKEVGPGYGISIVPLKYVSAETMTRMLTSLASSQDPPRASVYNNLLIVRGTARHRESLLEIVSMFDVDWMKGQSAGLYTLKNSAPDEVIKELQNVFEADGPGKGLVRFQSISRLNAILALTKRSKYLEEVETWVARLDRGGPEGDNYYVYRVENGRAKDLTEIVDGSLHRAGRRRARRRRVRGRAHRSRPHTKKLLSPARSTGSGAQPAAAATTPKQNTSSQPLALSACGPGNGCVGSARGI